jgi:CubicO group peptidase (beta-lactamase class C family)
MRSAAVALHFSGSARVSNGDIAVQGSFGDADADGKVPNTGATRFNMGSVTKLFTAFAIGRLVDRGVLRFDAPLSQYLADLGADFSEITIAQLLAHTSGLGDYLRPENRARIDAAKSATELLPLALAAPPAFAPGSQRAYSNSGYVVLGAVIEKLSDQSFAEFLRRQILEPLAMADTRLDSDGGATPMSRMWSAEGSNQPQPAAGPRHASPAGGIFSTPADLSRFLTAAMDGKLVSEATLAELLTPRPDPAGGPGIVGYGMVVRQQPTARIEVGGGAPGVNAEVLYFPASHWQIIVLSNFDPPVASQLAQVLERAVFADHPAAACADALANPAALAPRMVIAPPASPR